MVLRWCRSRINRMDRRFFNVLQVGLGFMLLFSAFQSQASIEQLVLRGVSKEREEANADPIGKNAGYYSLAIIYASFTLLNFLAAPIVNLIGAKWSMVIGAGCYTLLLVSFLRLTEWVLYITSAILGFGASIIWTGQGNYLTLNSNRDTISRNSGVLWAMLQMSLIAGGVFLYVVDVVMESQDGESDKNSIKESVARLIYGIFSGVAVVSIVVLALLRAPPTAEERRPEDGADFVESTSVANPDVIDGVRANAPEAPREQGARKFLREFVLTFRMLATRNMILLAVVFVYTGLELTYWSGVYPTSFGSTRRMNLSVLKLVAISTFASGIGQIIGGGAFGILGDRTNVYGRNPIIIMGCCVHLVTFFLAFVNLPMDAPLRQTNATSYLYPSVPLAILCALLNGFGDACWNTQIYSILGSLYPDNSAPAFALFKFFQSGSAFVGFLYAPELLLHWQLLILTIGSVIAALCFFPVEWDAQIKPHGVKVH